MKPSLAPRLLCLLVLLLPLAHPGRAEDIKKIKPTGYVTDLAGVISANTKTRLENLCTELEQKTGDQMAIVTVKSLDGESVEDYAVDLYKQLGVGNKKNNEGVLLLVAPEERKYRVEVGYGLEPVINDARAGDAGRTMVPFLRQGDFSGGIEAASWQLAKYLADAKGVTLTGAPPPRPARQQEDEGGVLSTLFVLGLVLFFFWLATRNNRNRPGGRGGSSGWWIGPMIGGWGGGGMRRGGGWGGGGFGGGGGWGGGGGGFGGFGGGMSGGGGASGSW